ncbi:hypothetical protein V494_08644 [Pseudogymnoascus sp. VKM F-4513 (FW-928)]|nr:hypothetical protein V494_08644 [Pseudogymnoascus sp. VKM F-4513 (FW-928)]
MDAQTHFHGSDLNLPVRLAPAVTTRIDVSSLLNPEPTSGTEHEARVAGNCTPVNSPIAPSPQSSPIGARLGRTPLPEAPPATSAGWTRWLGEDRSRLNALAEAASMSEPLPSRPARVEGGLKKYVEHVLKQEDRPMAAKEIHKAVVKLTGQEYQYQSVRKVLSAKESPFEPQQSGTWSMKSWGLSPGRMPRKFGTGGCTMEARKKWASAA